MAVRERLRKLNETSRHLAQGLEFERVLQGVADSARELTGGTIGGIAVAHPTDSPVEFVMSGVSADDYRSFLELPEGKAIYEDLTGLSSPLRVSNLAEYLASAGLGDVALPLDLGPALFVPILSRGETVGMICVSKAAPAAQFSDEDEATLAMFANQAALAIAIARRYRDEQRARTGLEALIDIAPVGVIVLDAKRGDLTLANREALRITDVLRVDRDEPSNTVPRGLTLHRAGGRETSLTEDSLSELACSSETVRAERVVVRNANGTSVSLLVNGTPTHDTDGAVSSLMVTLQDLSPVEDLERLRAGILRLASDELRAPLMAVKGVAATLLTTDNVIDAAEAAQLAHVVDVQADRMRDLIADLRDFAQIHTGTLSVRLEPVDAAQLLSVAAARHAADDNDRRITVDLDIGLPLVRADRQRVLRVLRSLLADAARSSDSSVPIHLSAARDNAHLTVRIAHRAGPTAALLVGLLERRGLEGTDGQRHSQRSSALELAICKGIIEAHGGRIHARSDLNGQTLVTFTLPFLESAATAPSLETAPRSAARAPGCRILVIDVDAPTQRSISEVLSAAGFELEFADDAGQAVHSSVAQGPDLVLAGIAHPADVHELLRTLQFETDAPLIVVTDHGLDDAALEALHAGAADYIAKPFSNTELIARVRAALHRNAALAEPAVAEPFVLGDLVIDYAQRRVAVAGRRAGLTETEYRLLCALAARPGRILSTEEIARRVWKTQPPGHPGPVRSVVKRLRRKLGDDARDPRYVITWPRSGYGIGVPDTVPQSGE